MNQEINAVLEDNEKIIWQDVISRKVLWFYTWIILVIILALSFYIFSQETVTYTSWDTENTISWFLLGFWVFLIGWLIAASYYLFSYVKIFTITNKRILIRSWIIGTDFNSIYYTEIKTLNVKVSPIDKIFWVGTVNIDTWKTRTVTKRNNGRNSTRTEIMYDKLLHISNPYDVYKKIQSSLSNRKESLFSGRSDRENNPEPYIASKI